MFDKFPVKSETEKGLLHCMDFLNSATILDRYTDIVLKVMQVSRVKILAETAYLFPLQARQVSYFFPK